MVPRGHLQGRSAVSANADSRQHEVITFGPFRLSPTKRLLERDNSTISIGSRALDVLIALAEQPGRVLSRRDLIRRAWPNLVVEETNLRVHVAGLRKVLGDGQSGARYVANIPGRGYCFVAPVGNAVAPEAASLLCAPQRSSITVHNLPARLARMVGRDETIVVLSELLTSHRFVSVVGPGGMGKTTVAVSVAHALLDDFGNAVFFVDFAGIREAGLVPSTVASVLGLPGQAPDPLPGLLAFLVGKRILLVLDNCEHVIDAAAALAERLYSEAPHIHLLTTSRETLRVEGEQVHLLAPLDTPAQEPDVTAERALASPAVQLFVERAAASGHRAPLTDADAAIVVDICRRLDGIALAIELAASRVGAYGIRGTADLLNNRFRLLWQGRRGALPRHQTLHAMLDWSFNLLSARDRAVLCRLALFAGTFTLEAAQCVAADAEIDVGEVAESLAHLVDKSLVWTSAVGGSGFFRLLDTTRTYAAAKLADGGSTDAAARRHALHFLEALKVPRIDFVVFGGRDPLGFAPHMADIRAALEWGFSNREETWIGVNLAAGSAPLLLGLSSFHECRRWCRRALDALADSGRGTPTELVLQGALAVSSMFALGNSEEVRSAIERGLALTESLGQREYQLHLLAGLHIFLTRAGDFRDAFSVAERSAVVAAGLGAPGGVILAEWMLGGANHWTGNQEAAQKYCDSGFSRAAGGGSVQDFLDCDHRILALGVAARVSWLRGYPDRAAQTSRRAVGEAQRSDRPVNICIALMDAATVYLWNGDTGHAAECISRLIAQATRFSLNPYLSAGTALNGELAIARGEFAKGVDILRDALQDLRAQRHIVVASRASRALAEGLLRLGHTEEATTIMENEFAPIGEIAETCETPEWLRTKAMLQSAVEPAYLSGAEATLLTSLELARRHGSLAWELRSAIALARLWHRQKRPIEAAALLADVHGRFSQGFDTADLKAAELLMSQITASRKSPSLYTA